MTIDEIEAFVSIARLGGFARAAEALHRSQPAISRRIEMLEEQLRTSIFERVRGGVLLTAAGRSFLPYAEAALASLKDGTEAVRGLERGEHGLVSVALVGTLASTRFAGILRQFGRRHPKVKLELRTANSQDVSDLVRRAEATRGLRYFAEPDTSLVSEVVMEEALVVASSPDHRLAGRRVREPGPPRGRAVGDLSPTAPPARAVRHRSRATTPCGGHRGGRDRPDRQPHRAEALRRGGLRHRPPHCEQRARGTAARLAEADRYPRAPGRRAGDPRSPPEGLPERSRPEPRRHDQGSRRYPIARPARR